MPDYIFLSIIGLTAVYLYVKKMKTNLDRIFHRLVNATVWGVTLIILLSSPLLANTIPHRVINGLYRSSSEDFFEQGRREFEQEIEILMQQLLIEPESLLNISDEVEVKEEEVLEVPDFSPGNIVIKKNQR